LAQRHKSAIKRHRQNVKRATRNQVVRTQVRHAVRTLRESIANKEGTVETQLRSVVRTLNQGGHQRSPAPQQRLTPYLAPEPPGRRTQPAS